MNTTRIHTLLADNFSNTPPDRLLEKASAREITHRELIAIPPGPYRKQIVMGNN
jgi:hypothetical protein